MTNATIIDQFLDHISKTQEPLPIGDDTLDRLPVVFAIDCSGSMQSSGDIAQINVFLTRFMEALASPPNEAWARVRAQIDLFVLSYASDAREVLPWTPGERITRGTMPTLTANGTTSMGAGLGLAVGAMMRRLADYRRRQTACCRGYIFNITDGNPTDMKPEPGDPKWTSVKTSLDQLETISSQGSAYTSTFHCASRTADRDLLRRFAYEPSRVIDLEQADFDKLFEFIRISLIRAVDEEEG